MASSPSMTAWLRGSTASKRALPASMKPRIPGRSCSFQDGPATPRLYGNVPGPPERAVALEAGILHQRALILAPDRGKRDEAQSSTQSSQRRSLDVRPFGEL